MPNLNNKVENVKDKVVGKIYRFDYQIIRSVIVC